MQSRTPRTNILQYMPLLSAASVILLFMLLKLTMRSQHEQYRYHREVLLCCSSNDVTQAFRRGLFSVRTTRISSESNNKTCRRQLLQKSSDGCEVCPIPSSVNT